MNRIIQYIFYSVILLQSALVIAQESNSVELHFQIYDEGICIPMSINYHHNSTKNQEKRLVFNTGFNLNRFYVSIKVKDSSDLKPNTNHKLKSSSLTLKSNLDYEIEILKYSNTDGKEEKKMNIKVSELKSDAQVIILLNKGEYKLNEMKHFKLIERNTSPDFKSKDRKAIKHTLKLDSTSYYANKKKKANFYIFPGTNNLYFTEEFDSINERKNAQGVRLIQPNHNNLVWSKQSVWADSDNTKCGYWDYFENDTLAKHELWASVIQERFEWYPEGQLKSESYFVRSNDELKHAYYLKNGAIKEIFTVDPTTKLSQIKTYAYSPDGTVVLINTYKSLNGIIKQGLIKRELFYPSGKLKMEENLGQRNYSIKYYNEDGTERNK
jgi:hypothetical protein